MHDLKHTFGYRLRTAGAPFEHRQSLLGHKAAHVTTHYSAADMENLISYAQQACDLVSRKSSALGIVKSAGAPQLLDKDWWNGRDSNPRPGQYECLAQTAISESRSVSRSQVADYP